MKISIICPLYKGEKYVDKIIEMIIEILIIAKHILKIFLLN